MKYIFNDGGRKEAGRKGSTRDCVCRAISIVTGLPYEEVYRKLSEGTAAQRKSKRTPKKARTASAGINVGRKWFKEYMKSLGFVWVPTMAIGSGCKVHLREDELPKGRLVVHVSKHSTAVIDGTIHDTYDPSREGTRCVYGFWMLKYVCPQCDKDLKFLDSFNTDRYGKLTYFHCKNCNDKFVRINSGEIQLAAKN